jgi:hypothetical protein
LPAVGHGTRDNWGNNIRDQIDRERPNRDQWFGNEFWGGHDYYPPYYGNNRNWWAWATVASLSSWLDWQAAPVYYDYQYGDDGYVWGAEPYYPDSSYSEAPQAVVSQPVVSEPYAPSQADSSGDEWMPLGVFALVRDGESKATPNIYLQLALNRSGAIAGTVYNAITDEAHGIEGKADSATQRVAMTVVDMANPPLLETGIYNLTQPESAVLVHFTNGSEQEMQLVRLEESQ